MRNVLFFCFLCLADILPAQSAVDSLAFPASWEGNWSGTLDIYNFNGKVQSVKMTVEIHKIDTSKQGRYTFGLIYGDKQTDWRPYELVPVNPKRGVWAVDEKNTIQMESYLYGPKLLCWFTVDGESRILCTYEKTGPEDMLFEVVSGSEKPVSTTGKSRVGEEDIPEVKTFPFTVFQRAYLKKTK